MAVNLFQATCQHEATRRINRRKSDISGVPYTGSVTCANLRATQARQCVMKFTHSCWRNASGGYVGQNPALFLPYQCFPTKQLWELQLRCLTRHLMRLVVVGGFGGVVPDILWAVSGAWSLIYCLCRLYNVQARCGLRNIKRVGLWQLNKQKVYFETFVYMFDTDTHSISDGWVNEHRNPDTWQAIEQVLVVTLGVILEVRNNPPRLLLSITVIQKRT